MPRPNTPKGVIVTETIEPLETRLLLDLLAEQIERENLPGPGDLLPLLLPLVQQTAEAHEHGLVAPLEDVANLAVYHGRAFFTQDACGPPKRDAAKLAAIDKARSRAFTITGETDTTDTRGARSRYVAGDDSPVTQPMYIPGYVCWEHTLEVHDELCDVFMLGMLLASFALNLDFRDEDDLAAFANRRENLFVLAPDLHPVIARVITRMTALSRHDRAQSLDEIVHALEHYQSQDITAALDFSDLRGFQNAPLEERAEKIHTRLRNQCFQLSRRNRLLYFKPTSGSLDLTVASVPLLLNVENIRPENLFFWHPKLAKRVAGGKAIPLAEFIRFEDAPYVRGILDKIRNQARRDASEYGFSQLRLVLCFLRWHNLKENKDERIHSPLLLLPVTLAKKKGVQDIYTLQAEDAVAEINPILRHHLHELYGLRLPEAIDLNEAELGDLQALLERQIAASEPGVTVKTVTQPELQLVHAEARLRMEQYRRRTRLSGRGVRHHGDIDYSYNHENYQPLGLQLYLRHVRPEPIPFHDIVTVPVPALADTAAEKAEAKGKKATFYALNEKGEASTGNPYVWELDYCAVTLGNFNYRKMSLVRDYNTILEENLQNPVFEHMFTEIDRAAAPEEPPLPEWQTLYPVVAGDPTQLKAIVKASRGDDYIIQGPPGTGKSQTITNLIANFVAQDKRVLFVCEKRAAIDVVFHRLAASGLESLCCLIHDSQADKKAFIMDLKVTYEDYAKQPVPDETNEHARNAVCGQLDRATERLTWFAQTMQSSPGRIGGKLWDHYEFMAACGGNGTAPSLPPEAAERLPDYALWRTHLPQLERLCEALDELGFGPILAKTPFRLIAPALSEHETPLETLRRALNAATPLLGILAEALDNLPPLTKERRTGVPPVKAESQGGTAVPPVKAEGQGGTAVPPVKAEGQGGTAVPPVYGRSNGLSAPTIAELNQALRFLKPLREPCIDGRCAEWLRNDSTAWSTFKKQLSNFRGTRTKLDKKRDSNRFWRNKLARVDTQEALAVAPTFERGLTRFLRPAYWRLRKLLLGAYNFDFHAVRPTWSRILKSLNDEYDLQDRLDGTERSIHEAAGIEMDPEALHALLDSVRESRERLDAPETAILDALTSGEPTRTAAGRLYDTAVNLQKTLDGILELPDDLPLPSLDESLRALDGHFQDVADILPLMNDLADTPPAVMAAARCYALPLDALTALVARESLARVHREDRKLDQFNLARLTKECTAVQEKLGEYFTANSRVIQDNVHRRFREHLALCDTPAAQLDPEQKAFKKQYSRGRRELEHEFGKVMRYRSIREVGSGESGLVVRDLKPIWLMSPLSVSDTLPIDPDLFDVVIFDEASQVPLEEAVPAVFRTRQCIVVGDEMQLPPTRFFTAASDGAYEEEDEDFDPLLADIEKGSLLSHCTRTLPAAMLGWHYRSRSESLISFSNRAFYNGELLTIPDRARPTDHAPITAKSAGDAATNLTAALARPISFHFLEHGVYQNRRNPAEAAYIAEMLRHFLSGGHNMSVGVVAFSEAQQDEIESAVNRIAADDRAFQEQLELEYAREENGQFCGLFVKNLENVQGDERDIVILSICYAPDANGKMWMNFGPINQTGGEKRLNVVFSRAKRHMAVVSSIRYDQITNTYNDGANVFRQYLEYAEACSGGHGAGARGVLDRFTAGRRKTVREYGAVIKGIAARLEAAGFVTEMGVGASGFRCDIAIRRPESTDWQRGVLVDGHESDRESTLSRYALQPAVLRAFGWHIELVTAKDWLQEPERMLKRLTAGL